MGTHIFSSSILGIICMLTVFVGWWIVAAIGLLLYIISWVLILMHREQVFKDTRESAGLPVLPNN